MYTRREMRIMKDGYVDLAKAVMRQWNMDGRPRGDEVGVQMWADLIREHQKRAFPKHGIKHGSTV